MTSERAHGTRLDRGGELPAVARLLPVVAEEVRAAELRDRDLRLPGTVRSEERYVLAGFERALRVEHVGARRDGDDHLAGERLGSARGDAGAEPLGDELPPRRVHVPDERYDAVRDEHPRRLGAVHAAADDGVGRRLRPAERVRCEHARGGGAERRHRGGVEHGEEPSVLGVGEEHEPGDRREAAGRVARERRDPLEERVAVSDRRHRTEVAGRVVRDVHLRRHRPLRARVRLEGAADGVVGLVRRDGSLDVGRAEDREPREEPRRP